MFTACELFIPTPDCEHLSWCTDHKGNTLKPKSLLPGFQNSFCLCFCATLGCQYFYVVWLFLSQFVLKHTVELPDLPLSLIAFRICLDIILLPTGNYLGF